MTTNRLLLYCSFLCQVREPFVANVFLKVFYVSKFSYTSGARYSGGVKTVDLTSTLRHWQACNKQSALAMRREVGDDASVRGDHRCENEEGGSSVRALGLLKH